MSYTRDEMVRLVEEMLDQVSSQRFGATLKLQALSTAFDRGWKRLLGANRTYRWQTIDVTTDSDGRVALTSLTTGSGDSAKRFYKLLEARQGTTPYTPVNDQADALNAEIFPTAQGYEVWRQGDYLQFTPVQSGTSIAVAVNHLPQTPKDLAGGSSTVTWPEGFEWVLAFETAALLFPKGGQDVGAGLVMRDQADELWQDLLNEVQRFSTDPLFIRATDSPSDWGSL